MNRPEGTPLEAAARAQDPGDRARSFKKVGATLLPLIGVGLLVPSFAMMFVFPTHEETVFIAFGAFMLYSVAGPVLVFFGRSFWLNSLTALLTWVAMFFALVAVAEGVSKRPMGEDSMVLLLPLMTFPGLVAVAGFTRLALWAAGRTAQAHRSPANPPVGAP